MIRHSNSNDTKNSNRDNCNSDNNDDNSVANLLAVCRWSSLQENDKSQWSKFQIYKFCLKVSHGGFEFISIQCGDFMLFATERPVSIKSSYFRRICWFLIWYLFLFKNMRKDYAWKMVDSRVKDFNGKNSFTVPVEGEWSSQSDTSDMQILTHVLLDIVANCLTHPSVDKRTL